VIFDTYASDPAVAKYMTWKPHRGVDDTVTFLHRCERVWSEASSFPWTLWRPHDCSNVWACSVRGYFTDG
jgi:ribosomal-protein-alanine N-acetyltransferase